MSSRQVNASEVTGASSNADKPLDSGRLKMIVLTQYFPPDGASWFPEAIAVEMKSRGHEVKVLTAFPHYTSGKIAEGYRQRLGFTEGWHGIDVRRVPIVPSHSKNPLGRIANYVSFIVTARTAKRFVEDSDVIYVYGTPATVAEPARQWSKSLGIPYVYHVQDIWPESVTESGFLPKRVLDLMSSGINMWLKRVYQSASATITIAPAARRMLIDRGVPSDRAHLVYNWADGPEHVARPSSPGLTVLYAGNLGDFQDIETVIRAAKKMADLPGFQLKIAGGGVLEDRLKNLASDLDAGNSIQFVGRVAKEDMADLYASADFQVVSLKDRDIFAGTIPSKFQAGLAHGLPVITTVKGDLSRLVEEHQLGFTARPEDVDSLAGAFRKAFATSLEERSRFSEQARAFSVSHFSRATAMDHIETILMRAAKPRILAK